MTRKSLVRATVAVVSAAGISLTLAGPASAVTTRTAPASCPTEVIIASQTTGDTTHRTSSGQSWFKGYKSNAGATTYTGKVSHSYVETTSTLTIQSSGFRCR